MKNLNLYIPLIIFFISNFIAFLFLLRFHMHMFQLSSYSLIEERRFLKEHFYPILGRVIGSVFSLVIIIIPGIFYLIIVPLINLITSFGNRDKKMDKIPLKYTPRVKRLFITSIIMYIVLSLLSSITLKNLPFKFTALILQAIHFIPAYIIILANKINAPIEKSINEKFINEARQILKSKKDMKVIGITGSFGKTSMKNAVSRLLEGDYNLIKTPGNYNTTLGVVITIRNEMTPLHDLFVCEMGAKGVGEIKEICDLVEPDIGILTSIGPMHLESFGSLENIEKTKFELIDSLDENGIAVLNYDNEIIKNHKIKGKKILSYAIENEDALYRPYNITTSYKGSKFLMKLPGDKKEYEFDTKLLGAHNVLNIAGAIAVAHHLGMDGDKIIQRVRMIEQTPHRLELKRTNFGLMIDDAYNSNPTGSKAAIDVLSQFEGLKILITPGMVELGEKQDEENYKFAKYASKFCDYIFLVGKVHTLPLQNGINEEIQRGSFDKNRLFVVNNINDAIEQVTNIKSDLEKIVLFENDLPDNY